MSCWLAYTCMPVGLVAGLRLIVALDTEVLLTCVKVYCESPQPGQLTEGNQLPVNTPFFIAARTEFVIGAIWVVGALHEQQIIYNSYSPQKLEFESF